MDPAADLLRLADEREKSKVRWAATGADNHPYHIDLEPECAFGRVAFAQWIDSIAAGGGGYPVRVWVVDLKRNRHLGDAMLWGPPGASGQTPGFFGTSTAQASAVPLGGYRGGSGGQELGALVASALSKPEAFEQLVGGFVRSIKGEPHPKEYTILIGEIVEQKAEEAARKGVREELGKAVPALVGAIQAWLLERENNAELPIGTGDGETLEEVARIAGIAVWRDDGGLWWARGRADIVRRLSEAAEDLDLEAPTSTPSAAPYTESQKAPA